MEGFRKDIHICLTGVPSKNRSGKTHAYFPALSACCGTLEYLTGLYLGRTGIGTQQVQRFSAAFMPQPDYGQDIVRVLFEAFRHSVAHRGIASGVWVDHQPGPGQGRRITWKLFATNKGPACAICPCKGVLKNDPPWECVYTHRMHIHLGSLSSDIRESASSYIQMLSHSDELVANFKACMKKLYPQ
jgi:hypothetical protein